MSELHTFDALHARLVPETSSQEEDLNSASRRKALHAPGRDARSQASEVQVHLRHEISGVAAQCECSFGIISCRSVLPLND